MRSRLTVVAVSFFAVLPVAAQRPTAGEPAPAIVADEWLNWDGDAPTVESLKGRVVLLEFWGTWCGPCVRAMPAIQKLHDRYRDRGLTVLAISYETPSAMRPFLDKNGYTMPVGSDQQKQTVTANGVRGWPTTVVLDKDGKVAHVGSPYDAEQAVEKALGIEAGAGTLLHGYCDAVDATAKRDALARLTDKASAQFDLRAWALGQLAPEPVAAGDAEAPAAEPAKKAGSLRDAVIVLRSCARAWADQTQRDKLLQQLADDGPSEFDLAAFALEAMADEFPFAAEELEAMLKDKKYAAAVEAIARRNPAAAVLAKAAKDTGLADYSRSNAADPHPIAKKGLMAALWVFPGALPKDEKTNSDFFRELSVSGFATSQDKKSITGITLGGAMVMRDRIDGYVATQLCSALVMDELGDGKKPKVKDLPKLGDKLRDKIVKDLEGRYGKPEAKKQ
jgi:peroxiredoxin